MDAKKWDACAPLTNLVGECGQTKTTKATGTKKASWHWDEIHQQAFDLIKTTLACNVVFAYLDYGEKFEICVDASKSQIGSVITQRNRPLAFFDRKLLDTYKQLNITKKITSCHCWNTQRVQRYVVGPKHHSLYRP